MTNLVKMMTNLVKVLLPLNPLIADAMIFIIRKTVRNFKMLKTELFPLKKHKQNIIKNLISSGNL